MNRYLKFILLSIAFVILAAPTSHGAEIPFHCDEDTAVVKGVIEYLAKDQALSRGQRIAKAALLFKDAKADNSLQEDSTKTLTLNVDSFDTMSLVNSCIALAKASGAPGAGWRTYAGELRDISCRKGEDEGFPSLFYHTSDWIGDNIYRGNLTELTDRVEGARNKTWSLDHLAANRDSYPVLADPETFDRVRMIEMGFRTHKIPFLPKQAISRKDIAEDLRDGDIIILISDYDRSDFYTFGIVEFESDGLHLVHFDSKQQKVVVEPEPLKRYFNLHAKHFSGFRWLRVN